MREIAETLDLLAAPKIWAPGDDYQFGLYASSGIEVHATAYRGDERLGRVTARLSDYFDVDVFEIIAADVVENDATGTPLRGTGLGLSLYLIATEEVGRICPNFGGTVSPSATWIWKRLPSYGTVRQLTGAEEETLLSRDAEINYSDSEDPQNDALAMWGTFTARGLDVIFSDPAPPPGYGSWRELVTATGGEWWGRSDHGRQNA